MHKLKRKLFREEGTFYFQLHKLMHVCTPRSSLGLSYLATITMNAYHIKNALKCIFTELKKGKQHIDRVINHGFHARIKRIHFKVVCRRDINSYTPQRHFDLFPESRLHT